MAHGGMPPENSQLQNHLVVCGNWQIPHLVENWSGCRDLDPGPLASKRASQAALQPDLTSLHRHSPPPSLTPYATMVI